MNNVNEKNLILGSSSYLDSLDIEPGYRFLVLNVSGHCNSNCPECWVQDIRKSESNQGGPSYKVDEIKDILQIFRSGGGFTVGVMASGEPMNYDSYHTHELVEIAKITGDLGLFLIINTNGQELNKERIEEFQELNPNIVFQVSYNADSQKAMDSSYGKKGVSGIYEENKKAWKDFIEKNKKVIVKNNTVYNISKFVLHAYVSPKIINEIPEIKKTATELGAALIVTEPGISECNERVFHNTDMDKLKEIAKEYSDNNLGATALYKDGQCAYISKSGNKYKGITIYPNGGCAIGIGPYFETLKSYSLRNYQKGGGNDLKSRYTTAQRIITLITDTIFEKYGDYYCLKRHEKNNEISKFVLEFDNKLSNYLENIPINDKYFSIVEKYVKDILNDMG